MIDAYKNFSGAYSPIKDGDTKHDADFKILTRGEYAELQQEIRELKKNLADEKENRKRDVLDEKANSNSRVNNLEHDYDKKISRLRGELDECREKKEFAESLNKNLKRICRENANAKRGITPKKKKSGYVAVRSEHTCRVWYEKNSRRRKEAPVWRTTIETPHSVTLTEDQTRQMVYDDINYGYLLFDGSYYADYRLIKDMRSGFWTLILETENEFLGTL